MDRIQNCQEKFEKLFGGKPTQNEGNDPGFMRILQRFIFGEVSYTGPLDDRVRELVTITVLTVNQTLPQLKAHVAACLHIGISPADIREAVYQCAPFIGFPKTLNAIAAMDEAFAAGGVALPLDGGETVTEENRLEQGLAVQVHVGAMRNNNTRMYKILGADTGYDSIDDSASIASLSRWMDALDSVGELPKMVLFNLNPVWNLPLTTLAGCFQDSGARGKIQFGPAWWFLDHCDGIRAQLDALADTGHIGTFIGMLTDSRSFLSYPRHQYFRRIFCDWIGRKAEAGEIAFDFGALASVVRDVSYNNAAAYFGAEGNK